MKTLPRFANAPKYNKVTLPVLDALKVQLTGRRQLDDADLPPMVTKIHDKVTQDDVKMQHEYEASATIGFTQFAPINEERFVRLNAVRTIANHIYGPIGKELQLVLEDLWKSGARQNSPAVRRVESLIRVIRAEEPLTVVEDL